MKYFLFLALLPVVLAGQSSELEFVNPKELIPDIVIDLRYSSADHSFLNLPEGDLKLPKFYSANECLLVYDAVLRLKSAQDSLRNIRSFDGREFPQGIGIKIWDGYRPRAVQYLFWEIYPNSTYIANPNSGSRHNRGGAVDLTLIDLASGAELDMPTAFDDFSTTASHSYTNLPEVVLHNRELLRSVMTTVAGFEAYDSEWWHYQTPGSGDLPLRDFQLK